MVQQKTDLSLIPVANVTATRFSEKLLKGKDYVLYGSDNKFPDYLWAQYTQCPTHQSVIDGKVDYILGNGFTDSDKVVNRKGETLFEVVKKCALDQQIYGGYAMQVIYKRDGSVSEVYWADFGKLRISENDMNVYWSSQWGGYKNDVTRYDAFDKSMTNKTSQILYCRASTCRSYYPIPSYIAALDAIETEAQIQHYHLNNITKGFNVSAIINMNGGIPATKEERDEMERKIKDKFTGSENANGFLISWNKSKDTACTIERLEADDFDKKFQQLAKDTQRNIFVAHRVTSPCLFGIVPENTGFSKEEYAQAFEVFNRTIIVPQQKDIAISLRKIFDKDFVFDKFKLD